LGGDRVRGDCVRGDCVRGDCAERWVDERMKRWWPERRSFSPVLVRVVGRALLGTVLDAPVFDAPARSPAGQVLLRP
jgi:hypothetical protein